MKGTEKDNKERERQDTRGIDEAERKRGTNIMEGEKTIQNSSLRYYMQKGNLQKFKRHTKHPDRKLK